MPDALERSRTGLKNAGVCDKFTPSGSPGGTIARNSAFNTALIESGFSRAEVTRILSALNEAGLAVVAMGAGAEGKG